MLVLFPALRAIITLALLASCHRQRVFIDGKDCSSVRVETDGSDQNVSVRVVQHEAQDRFMILYVPAPFGFAVKPRAPVTAERVP